VYRSSETRIGHQSEVSLTRNIPLCQTFRYGLTDYKFDVVDGEYEVELHFSDLESKNQKSIYDVNDKEDITKEVSEFNVSINDKKVLDSFSPSLQYGALNAVVKSYVIAAKNLKGLTVSFEQLKGNTLLNAIKVRRLN
jgi:beta-galactosidase